MNSFGIAFVACLCLISGVLIGAGDFTPIINAGVRLEATRVVLANSGDRFVEAYRERRQEPQDANFHRPLQMPARHEDCGLVYKERSDTYGWACGPHVLGIER